MILLTGGAGYIGAHITVLLELAGHSCIIADNLSNGTADNLKGIETLLARKIPFYEIDIKDEAALETIFQDNPISSVIHLAALKSIVDSINKPLDYFSNNVGGTLALLQCMKRNKVKHFVFSSSATIYATKDTPIVESDPLQPSNPYGQTKANVEGILKALSDAEDNWHIASLRYFNPTGAHPSGFIGEHSNNAPSNLLPCIINAALGKSQYLPVYGSDYPTPDGTAIRDYIHVLDLAQAHINALEYITSQKGFHAFNLGTGKGTSILEMIQAFEKATGKSIHYQMLDRRAGDNPVSLADSTLAQNTLNWKAEHSLAAMCTDAWHSYRMRDKESK